MSGKHKVFGHGDRALWIAVVHRAWLDIVHPKTIGAGEDNQKDGATHSQRDAVDWALRDDTTVGSLRWICEAAQLPDNLLGEMQAIAARALAARRYSH